MKLINLKEARYHRSSYAKWVTDTLDNFSLGDDADCIEKDVAITKLEPTLKELTDAFGPHGSEHADVEYDYIDYQWTFNDKYYVELFSYGPRDGQRYMGLCISAEHK